MIKVINSKFRDEYESNFPLGSLELKKSENRESSKRWKNNIFPEKMFLVFQRFLERKAKIQNHFTFIDVGAAEGCYSCNVLRVFNKCSVLAFEPEKPRLEVMLENVRDYCSKYDLDENNFDFEIHEKIVSDGTEEILYLRHYVDPTTGGGAGSSTLVKKDRYLRNSIDVKYEAVCLDDFVDYYKKVDAIKIDVEGAELLVIKGATKFLNKLKPLIFLEVHGGENFGTVTLEDVKSEFKKIGVNYNFLLIEEHKNLKLFYYLAAPSKD